MAFMISACGEDDTPMDDEMEDEMEEMEEDDEENEEVINEVGCLYQIEGDCAQLEDHATITMLKDRSCIGYCVMGKFVTECNSININGENLSPEAYLSHFFEDDSSVNDSITSLSVMVHEATHKNAWTVNGLSAAWFLHECDQFGTVHFTETFMSRELVDLIPDDHMTLRFGTYINSSSDLSSTQSKGVFGLLGEFSAYYSGILAAYEFAPDPLASQGFLRSQMQAFHEFRYYIALYMIHAETNHPSIYAEIMANDDFRQNFAAVYYRYENLVEEFLATGAKLDIDPNDNIFNIIETCETSEYLTMFDLLLP